MVKMIREAQPVGPYRLGGWSFGGLLAYEIAAQLISSHQEVSFLGLFDTTYGGSSVEPAEACPEEFNDKDELLQRIEQIANYHSEASKELHAAMIEIRSCAPAMDFAGLTGKCREMELLPGHLARLTAEQLRQHLERGYYHRRASSTYTAQPVPIAVHLFVASDNHAAEPLRGWNRVLPETLIRVVPVAGTHFSMMTAPNVQVLAHAISRAMRNEIPVPTAHAAQISEEMHEHV
jgi:arthrofactin-type cyclic lipopeptide synthetase C